MCSPHTVVPLYSTKKSTALWEVAGAGKPSLRDHHFREPAWNNDSVALTNHHFCGASCRHLHGAGTCVKPGAGTSQVPAPPTDSTTTWRALRARRKTDASLH